MRLSLIALLMLLAMPVAYAQTLDRAMMDDIKGMAITIFYHDKCNSQGIPPETWSHTMKWREIFSGEIDAEQRALYKQIETLGPNMMANVDKWCAHMKKSGIERLEE